MYLPTSLEARQQLVRALPSTAGHELLDQLHYELKETPPAWADRQGERLPPALADAAARLWQRAPHEHAAAVTLTLTLTLTLALSLTPTLPLL